MPMSEIIKLTGISEFGRHGVYENEKQNKQEFIVDITLELNRTSLKDNIESTVDYANLTHLVREIIATKQFELIESLAQDIADVCMLESILTKVEIIVHKPGAAESLGIQDVSVSVTKTRT